MKSKRHLLVILLGFLILAGCSQQEDKTENTLGVWLGGQDTGNFERAIKPREFVFPQDHYAHPGFRNEWWYVTGNITDKKGHAFGYQVTFFRIGLNAESKSRPSAWAANSIWMVHIALTDIAAERHYHDERLSRGALGLAGIQQQPFRVWLEDWQILGGSNGVFPWLVSVSNDDIAINLQLSPEKPIVLQGDNGLSQKSAGEGNASYYYSLTRLQTSGTVTTPDASYAVTGLSWLDREWSTSVLGDDQVGWDWFSLQLQDGTDLMYYQLRKQNGEADEFSTGKWIELDGTSRDLRHQDVKLQPVRFWTSPAGTRYPVEWKLDLPDSSHSWLIKAAVESQEMTTIVSYWEGAVRVIDRVSGQQVGKGYLEMTGY